MMKKILSILFLVLSLVLLAGCRDRRVYDESIKVVYYKYQNAATEDELNPEIPEYEVYKEGDLIIRPEDPVREGYSFEGWFRDPQRTKLWDFENDRLGDKTIILYAKWGDSDITITFELNGGTLPNNFGASFDEEGEPYFIVKGGTSKVLNPPTKIGYKFLGWFLYDEYGWTEDAKTSFKPGDTPSTTTSKTIFKDIKYYAHWDPQVIVLTFNINFPTEGGPDKISSSKINYEEIIDFPILVDTTGKYEFKGWNSNKEGTGTWYVNGEPFLRTSVRAEMFAIWEEK